jgi:hypothetical protein
VQDNKEQEVLTKVTICCIKIMREYESQSKFGMILWSEYQIHRLDIPSILVFIPRRAIFEEPADDVFHTWQPNTCK